MVSSSSKVRGDSLLDAGEVCDCDAAELLDSCLNNADTLVARKESPPQEDRCQIKAAMAIQISGKMTLVCKITRKPEKKTRLLQNLRCVALHRNCARRLGTEAAWRVSDTPHHPPIDRNVLALVFWFILTTRHTSHRSGVILLRDSEKHAPAGVAYCFTETSNSKPPPLGSEMVGENKTRATSHKPWYHTKRTWHLQIQPNNQTTKQPNNQTTKQTTKQPNIQS